VRSVELEVCNATGLHARPAAQFVRAATGFRSTVRVRNLLRQGSEADAKSIIGVLGLGVGHGGRIEVTADGDDELEAIEALQRLVESGLGEVAVAPAD
jgi:phosphocarrier protein